MLEKEKDEKYAQTFNAEKTPKKLPPLNGPKMNPKLKKLKEQNVKP